MGVVQRIDLPQAGESAHAAASALVPALLRDGARSVTIIGYEMITGSSVAPAEVLSGLAAAEGIEVVDTLVVRGDRWWSTACQDPTGCPAEGKPLSGSSAAAAELIGVGCAPLPDRAAVAARLAPTARAASLVAECERQGGTPGAVTAARGLAAWARVLGTTDDVPVTDLPDSALCLAALVLQDIEARDGLIGLLYSSRVLPRASRGSLPQVLRAMRTSTTVPARTGVGSSSTKPPTRDARGATARVWVVHLA
jgi:hypothetical protein